jgi:hypothetical protein
MLIGIYSLGVIISIWLDNEAVIRMNISRCIRPFCKPGTDCLPRLIAGMMTRSNSIYVSASGTSPNCISIVLGSRREGEVHEMGNGGLATSTIGISRGSLIIVNGCLRRLQSCLRIPPLYPHPQAVVSGCSCVAFCGLDCSGQTRELMSNSLKRTWS